MIERLVDRVCMAVAEVVVGFVFALDAALDRLGHGRRR